MPSACPHFAPHPKAVFAAPLPCLPARFDPKTKISFSFRSVILSGVVLWFISICKYTALTVFYRCFLNENPLKFELADYSTCEKFTKLHLPTVCTSNSAVCIFPKCNGFCVDLAHKQFFAFMPYRLPYLHFFLYFHVFLIACDAVG